MALTYEQTPSELHTFGPRQLKKRLYKVVAFEAGYGRVTLRLHSEASRASTDLSKFLKSINKRADGVSSIDYSRPHELLRLSPSVYTKHVLFEGIHFDMDLAAKLPSGLRMLKRTLFFSKRGHPNGHGAIAL